MMIPAPSKPACPLCGQDKSRDLGGNPDFPATRVQLCSHCGFMWTSPRPTIQELKGLYETTYREVRKEAPTDDYLTFMDARARAQVEFISQTSGGNFSGMRVLDIGCGVGSFLKVCEERGATVFGFEPDIAMAGTATKRLSANARIFNTVFSPETWHEGAVDLIAMSHVLEHVPEIQALLESLRAQTRPRGHLFIEVPNERPKSVQTICKFKFRGLMHLYFFNAKTLERSLENAGWKPLSSATCGDDLDKWIASIHRARSLPWRILRRVRRLMTKCKPPEPPTWRVEPLTLENPAGEWLRTIASA